MIPVESNIQHNILPADVVPLHYNLTITPNLDIFEFSGFISITIKVMKSTRSICLNACHLNIASIQLVKQNKIFNIVDFSSLDNEERLLIHLEELLEKGEECVLAITYKGIISEDLKGFYRSEFKDPTGTQRFLATTQFEPTEARKAFPCWDEPGKKCTFDICLKVQDRYTALSNMDIISSEPSENNGWKIVRFRKTPLMSTYLIAFIVGELESIEAVTNHGVPMRVWTPIDYIEQTRFALDVGCKSLDYFTDYFRQPYSLPKMDMIAIPDFAAGAMENWGLITYRMDALLVDERDSTLSTKEGVANTVAHEIAHQWFGNLVTMEWWSDLWLKEGFATWIAYLALDHFFPEWNVWRRFILDETENGMNLDALRSSHPIEVPVPDPADISQIFDSISYCKGASLIRMLQIYLGEEIFQKGLQIYLEKYKFGNACTKDLWESLSIVSSVDIALLTSEWTLSMGYPCIYVELLGKRLKVSQSRFLLTGEIEEESIWHVPLTILATNGPSEGTSKILARQSEILSEDIWIDNFLKLNARQVGFYRVHYCPELFQKIRLCLAHNLFSVEDRLGIYYDAFVLGMSGKIPTTQFLDLLNSLKDEKEYVIWADIAFSLGKLKSVWFEEDETTIKKLENLICSLFSPLATSLGWEYSKGESENDSLLRTLAIPLSINNGNKVLLQEARVRFIEFLSGNEEAIPTDLRGPIFGAIIKFGSSNDYDSVGKIYRETKVADQKTQALAALSYTQDTKLILRTLEFSLSKEVRSQDIIYVYRNISSNFKARRMAWSFLQEYYSTFHDRFYEGSTTLLMSIIAALLGNLTTLKDIADIRLFFKDKETSSISTRIDQSVERIGIHANWLEREKLNVSNWLHSRIP